MIKDMEKGFSILIPTLGGKHLDMCIRAIRSYSVLDHEIVVHFNGCEPHSRGEDISTHSSTNLGVCGGLNRARSVARNNVLFYMNDDHFVLPGWDIELLIFYRKNCMDLGKMVWLSSTPIEPAGSNPCCIAPRNYGTVDQFEETRLLTDLRGLQREKRPVVSTWPPHLLHAEVWDAIGGYDEDYWPGFCSDPDIVKRCYDYGVRNFVGVPRSLVYHFMCETTKSVDQSLRRRGHEIFWEKHGMSANEFAKELGRGEEWILKQYA